MITTLDLQLNMRTKRQIKKSSFKFPLCKSIPIASNILHLGPSYKIYPSAKQIIQNNCIVKGLTIANQHSSITWRDEVNLNTINDYCLRDIIDLGKDYVQVYPRRSPRIGTQLNQPCIATFFKAVDMQKCKLSYYQLIKYLHKRAQKMGVQLISFDVQTGQLKLSIQHFTKYSMELDMIQDVQTIQNVLNSVAAANDQSVFQNIEINQLPSSFSRSPLSFFKPKQQSISNTTNNMRTNQVPSVNKPIIFNKSFGQIKQMQAQYIQEDTIKQKQSLLIPLKVFTSTPSNIRLQNDIKSTNQKLFQYNPIKPSIIDFEIRQSGNGYVYQLGTQQNDNIILASKLNITTKYQQAQMVKLLAKEKSKNPFEILKNIITSESKVQSYLKQLLVLINILFNRQNAFVTFKNGNIVLSPHTQPLQYSIKDWFQIRMQRQKIVSTSQNFQLLFQRKPLELASKYIRLGNTFVSEIVTRLEDKAFLSLFKANVSNIPKEIAAILQQVHLQYITKESWVTKMASNIFYGRNINLAERIHQVLQHVDSNNPIDSCLYRILSLYVELHSGKRSYTIRDNVQSVQDSIISWYISNILANTQKQLMNKHQYQRARHRILKNLLAKITHNETKVRIINYDDSLTQQQRSRLLSKIGPFNDEQQDLTTLQGVYSKVYQLRRLNKQFQVLQLLTTSPLTSKLSSTQQQLQNKLSLVFSSSPSHKQQYLRMIYPYIQTNSTLKFYKLLIDISQNTVGINIQVLRQLYLYIQQNPSDSIVQQLNKIMVNGVLANIQYFGRVFKQHNDQNNQIYEYLLINTKDRKNRQKLQTIKLPQL